MIASNPIDIAEGFRNYRKRIVKEWVDYTLSTYASPDFFIKEGDRFANPVGGNVREALEKIFVLLSTGAEGKKYTVPLEQIISIRLVQEFSPAEAVAPLNAVKHITRDIFAADSERKHLLAELYDFEFAVDLLVLTAFDIYMRYRERLYQVRLNEIRSGRSVVTDSGCPSNRLFDKGMTAR